MIRLAGDMYTNFTRLILEAANGAAQPKSTAHQQSGQSSKSAAGKVQRSISKPLTERELAKQKKFEALLNSPPKNLLG